MALGLLLVIVVVAGGAWILVSRVGVEQVTPDLYVMTGIGGNTAVLVTPQGAVVVDTMTFVRQGEAIRARISQLTPEPVVAVINTHYHRDHTHGNPAFAPGTPVVSTARTLEHLRQRDADYWSAPAARDLLPNTTFDAGYERRVGGKTVRASFLGRGHTDGDLVVLFVEDRVVHVGDLLFNGYYPNIDLEAGGSLREWSHTIDRILTLPFDRVIPGHGPVTDRNGLIRFRDFLNSLWTQTKTAVDRGASADQVVELVDLDPFGLRILWFAPQLNREFVIRRAYEEAKEHRSDGG
jgi:cyclase